MKSSEKPKSAEGFSDYNILPEIYVILTPFRPEASITRYEK